MSRPQQAGESGPVPVDGSCLAEVFARFHRPAFALARRILRDDGLAEDVVQEVFLAVWRTPGAFDPGRGSFSTWLMTMVHHRCVDMVRREQTRRRHQTRADDLIDGYVPDVADEACERSDRDRVRGALATLPAMQREVIVLAYFGGYTQRQIAALTSAPLGTVKTRALAGMRALRRELESAARPAGTSTASAVATDAVSAPAVPTDAVTGAAAPTIPVPRRPVRTPRAGRRHLQPVG